jgi:hypothetical protein
MKAGSFDDERKTKRKEHRKKEIRDNKNRNVTRRNKMLKR